MPETNDAVGKELPQREFDATKPKDVQQMDDLLLQQKLDTVLKQLEAKETEVHRLQDQLSAALEKGGADELTVRELRKVTQENRALQTETGQQIVRIVELEGSLEISARELDRSKTAMAAMEAAYVTEQEEKNRLQSQLDVLDQRTQAAFEMADISKYLTGVINEFNDSANTGDAAVNYIIKGLEVDMKAHIAKTEDDRMLMSAPSLTASGEDSLSSIKFSIAPVPKDMAASD